jgi:hypothetical protein
MNKRTQSQWSTSGILEAPLDAWAGGSPNSFKDQNTPARWMPGSKRSCVPLQTS